MLTRPGQNTREAALRRYFAKLPEEPSTAGAVIMIFIGSLLLLFAVPRLVEDSSSGFGIILLLAGLSFALIGWMVLSSARRDYEAELKKLHPQPSDQQVQEWLEEGVAQLQEHSGRFLGLDSAERDFTAPLVIHAPVLSWDKGLDRDDLLWKQGRDSIFRFGVYRITFVRMTDRHLAAYSCYYDFIRDIPLHERTEEFHFCDVVSFTTQEISETEGARAGRLDTRLKATTQQELRVSVGNGDGLKIALGDDRVREVTGEERVPATGAEETIAAIRAMLRNTKRKEDNAGLAA